MQLEITIAPIPLSFTHSHPPIHLHTNGRMKSTATFSQSLMVFVFFSLQADFRLPSPPLLVAVSMNGKVGEDSSTVLIGSAALRLFV